MNTLSASPSYGDSPIDSLFQRASLALFRRFRFRKLSRLRAEAASSLATLDARMRYDLGLSDIIASGFGNFRCGQPINLSTNSR